MELMEFLYHICFMFFMLSKRFSLNDSLKFMEIAFLLLRMNPLLMLTTSSPQEPKVSFIC